MFGRAAIGFLTWDVAIRGLGFLVLVTLFTLVLLFGLGSVVIVFSLPLQGSRAGRILVDRHLHSVAQHDAMLLDQ